MALMGMPMIVRFPWAASEFLAAMQPAEVARDVGRRPGAGASAVMPDVWPYDRAPPSPSDLTLHRLFSLEAQSPAGLRTPDGR
jgi:hypothetical protein